MLNQKLLSASSRAEIAERASNAAPGPWFYNEPWDRGSANPYDRVGIIIGPAPGPGVSLGIHEPADGEFIAYSRTDIPALLGHAAAMESLLREFLDALLEGAQNLQPNQQVDLVVDA